jgi:hypothetical protein
MNQFQINAYECIKNPKVISTWPVSDWLNNIKFSPWSDTITKARLGEFDYDITKASLPCVTFNFLFDGYKKNDNIIDSTGLIYIDVDHPSFDVHQLDTSKIFSYFHSFGGVGYAILVKASGITESNFSSTYENIVSDLGISEYVDGQAIKASQYNVLSYDENIFVNESSFTYSPVSPPSVVILNKRKEAYTIDGVEKSTRLRFSNIDEVKVDGDYVVNWDGYEIIKCFIPMKKVTANRNNMLLSYCNNLVWLNPHLESEKVLKVMSSVNDVACAIPVDEEQLHRIVDSVMKYYADGTLQPHITKKKRKIVFAQDSKLSRLEKLEVCRAELRKRWSDISTAKLYLIIEAWDFDKMGKISQPKIYNNHSISKKTVEKYWKHFKEYVAELNKLNTVLGTLR